MRQMLVMMQNPGSLTQQNSMSWRIVVKAMGSVLPQIGRCLEAENSANASIPCRGRVFDCCQY
jgi:hypothetical protein